MPRPIHVFVRHCNVSSNSVNKVRPDWFTKEKALQNLLATKDDLTDVTILLDTGSSDQDPSLHFTDAYQKRGDLKVVPIRGGTDAHSFINLIEYVTSQTNIRPNDIVYLLEDDYIHREGWCKALREAFDADLADYVTLYDHSDKYGPLYKGLRSELFVTPSSHWRMTPSTTNTYAMLFDTLQTHKSVHLKFSDVKVGYTFDHNKFMYLNNMGKKLVSSIPGFSTHVEQEYLSPVVDWKSIMQNI